MAVGGSGQRCSSSSGSRRDILVVVVILAAISGISGFRFMSHLLFSYIVLLSIIACVGGSSACSLFSRGVEQTSALVR